MTKLVFKIKEDYTITLVQTNKGTATVTRVDRYIGRDNKKHQQTCHISVADANKFYLENKALIVQS